MQTITCEIAAVFRYPAGKPLMKAMVAGDPYYLEREPSNPHDPNAIKVLQKDPDTQEMVQVGYVSRMSAAVLSDKTLGVATKGELWNEIRVEFEECAA